jgi:hypothetical protein
MPEDGVPFNYSIIWHMKESHLDPKNYSRIMARHIPLDFQGVRMMETQILYPADFEIHSFPELYDKATRTSTLSKLKVGIHRTQSGEVWQSTPSKPHLTLLLCHHSVAIHCSRPARAGSAKHPPR